MSQFIKVDVPEGHHPQSMPVDPSKRIPKNNIVLSRITDADLPDIVRSTHSSNLTAITDPSGRRNSLLLSRSNVAEV